MYRHIMEPTARGLKALREAGDDIITNASRSLELLKTIDQTIDGLCYTQRMLETISSFLAEFAEELRSKPCDKPIEPEGDHETALLKAQEAIEHLWKAFIEKRECARRDKALRVGDGVEEEYTRAIAVIADLHNHINEVRWTLMEHNADLEGTIGKEFSSVVDLKAYLESL